MARIPPRPAAPRSRRSQRERLIDAALACVARDGIDAFGAAAVAKEAGVGRATIYRHFADRDELLATALQEVGESVAKEMAARIAQLERPADMAVEGSLSAVRMLATHPVITRVWSNYPAEFGHEAELLNSLIGCQPLIEAMAWGPAEADEAVFVILRTIVALHLMPLVPNTDDAVRGYLRRRLLPALGIANE